jgi:hypothetical protein
MQLTYWAMIERLDRRTPFGRDSVPLVYISRSVSSSATCVPGGVASSCPIQACASSQPSAGDAPIHPLRATSASATAGCSASSTITPDAPECPRMNAISSAPSMKLIGTITAPSRARAKFSTTYSTQLCDSTAIRSPFATPRCVSAFATRLTAASSSA